MRCVGEESQFIPITLILKTPSNSIMLDSISIQFANAPQ